MASDPILHIWEIECLLRPKGLICFRVVKDYAAICKITVPQLPVILGDARVRLVNLVCVDYKVTDFATE